MLRWLTLEAMKRQCRIEPDFTDEDEWLEATGEAEEETVLNILNRSYEDLIETYGKVPMPIVQATLELVDKSYQHRSAIGTQQMYLVPYTIDYRIKNYVKLTSNEQSNNTRYGCKNL